MAIPDKDTNRPDYENKSFSETEIHDKTFKMDAYMQDLGWVHGIVEEEECHLGQSVQWSFHNYDILIQLYLAYV